VSWPHCWPERTQISPTLSDTDRQQNLALLGIWVLVVLSRFVRQKRGKEVIVFLLIFVDHHRLFVDVSCLGEVYLCVRQGTAARSACNFLENLVYWCRKKKQNIHALLCSYLFGVFQITCTPSKGHSHEKGCEIIPLNHCLWPHLRYDETPFFNF
jgi:hypothetical protein